MKKLFTILIGIFSFIGLVLFFAGCQNNLEKQNKEINLGAEGNTYTIDLELDNSQYLSITDADQTGLDLSGNFTMEAWIKLESLPPSDTSYYITSKYYLSGSGDNDRSYTFFLYNTGSEQRFYCNAYQDDTTSDQAYIVWSPSAGTWYHLAATFTIANATATEFEFFVGGVSQGNGTVDKDNNISSIQIGEAPFCIGARGDPTYYFDGLIDDVRVWNDIRTDTEISDNYNCSLSGNEANLVGYWKLDNSLLDETSNNNDLTNNNSAVFQSSSLPFTDTCTTATRRIIIIE